MRKTLVAGLLAFLGLSAPAFADGQTRICIYSVNANTGNDSCWDVSPNNPLSVAVGGYSPLQTPVAISATGAASTATATLAAQSGKTNYLTGFEVTGAGATAGSVITATVTGPTNTLSYNIVIPAGVTTSITPLQVAFNPPLAASATNTAISVSVPSAGSGNTNMAVTAHGFYQ